MSSDSFDCTFIEVSRISKQATCDVEGMLQSLKGLIEEGELGALPKLEDARLGVLVEGLHPAVMGRGISVVDMVLEDNDIRVLNDFSIGGGENRCRGWLRAGGP